MPLDHYVTLGRSGLRVSPLCLGAMTFGEDLGWGSSVEESQQIIDRYIELGGNFIDTANFYTKSHSEKIIGDHVGRHPARRDRLVIATKFSGNLYPGDPNGGGSGRKSIDRRLRELAAPPADRLHRSVLAAQLGRAHARSTRRWRRSTTSCAPARSATSASRTRRRGRSREANVIGALPRLVAVHRACRSSTRCSSARVEQELVPMARELGLGITPWSPLKSGALSGKYTRKQRRQMKARSRRVRRAVRSTRRPTRSSTSSRSSPRRTTRTVARVALAWVQAQPGVTSTIIGARRSRSSKTTSRRST